MMLCAPASRVAMQALISLLAVITVLLPTVLGHYTLTFSRKWIPGSSTQFCSVIDGGSQGGQVNLKIYAMDEPSRNFGSPWGRPFFQPEDPMASKNDDQIHISETAISLNPGQECQEVSVPVTRKMYGRVEVLGKIDDTLINETRELNFAIDVSKTFVQTDKPLYKYSMVYIESPSGGRIKQWLNVDNQGLVHLEFELNDEPEEGTYFIKTQNPETDEYVTQTFKIEPYTLPRFDLTIVPPSYILATDELLKFEVCAKYTFGQPLRGNLTLNIENNGYRRFLKKVTLRDEIFGCKNVEVPLRSFDVNNRDYFVYRISINAEIEESGTGNTDSADTSVEVMRSGLKIEELGTNSYKKPELPYWSAVQVTRPDGSPAGGEPMSVCSNEVCRNFTTDPSGKLQYAVPPHLNVSPKVSAINYPDRILPGGPYPRPYMYEVSFNPQFTTYYSPTNSSLAMFVDTAVTTCRPGAKMDLTVRVMFSSINMTEADLYVLAVSRGNIQYSTTQKVSFSEGPLPVDEKLILEPMMKPFSPHTVRGAFDVNLSIPSNVSPSLWVVMWYVRPDGEVVSDAREIKIEKCLDNPVDLKWAQSKVEQGTPVNLALSAEPKSLCSLGIVDKSVELISQANVLTLDDIFTIVDRTMVSPWENSQVDDYKYCMDKRPVSDDPSNNEPPGPVPLPAEPAMPVENVDFVPEEIVAKPVEDATEKISPVETRRKRFSPPYFFGRSRTNHVDALKSFDESGLYVISDLTLETRPCVFYDVHHLYLRGSSGSFARPLSLPFAAPPGVPGIAGAPGPAMFDTVDSGSFFKDPVAKAEPRTYFPETWLWDFLVTEESGQIVQNLTLPNTITEWVGRAVCVHPDKGAGISDAARVTAFTPFFIDLTVFPTIKKGETMPLKISVFNYLEEDLPVRVSLEPSEEYDILGESGSEKVADQVRAGERTACIPVQDKVTFSIRIRPTVVGQVNLTVTAVANSASVANCGSATSVNKVDRIISPITVVYEGFIREKTWSKYVCSEDLNEHSDKFVEWHLEAPSNIVQDSARAWVTVAGDLMGPTLDNLGSLIRMPYGCGEQNMLNFAPLIYLLRYLDASRQSNEEVGNKIRNYMEKGYQRELNYKRRDASYSAFGDSDESGSTWLSAFVLKSFAQARQYIDIPSSEIEMTKDWLITRQLENGCFEAVGKVLHKGMKGGQSEGGHPGVLAAYIMAALLEAGEDPNSKIIANVVFCLDAVSSNSNDPYYAALKAYALSIGKLPQSDQAIDELLAMAKDDQTGLTDKGEASASAVAVETAGYGLLALVNRDIDKYNSVAAKIVRWIAAQRNSQGGFVSTQDTVVALQALAEYESYQTLEAQNMTVTFSGNHVNAAFKLDETNKLLTQQSKVQHVPTDVDVSMTGTGCALVQGVVRYNVPDPDPSEAFSMKVSTGLHNTICKGRTIEVCAKYLLNDKESNMAIIEVGLQSGFIPDKESLKRVVGYGTGIFKRYEVDGNKVLFYVDRFTKKEICLKITALEEVEVENAKPGTVTVYDYYDPKLAISQTYEFPRSWFCETRPEDPTILLPGIIVDTESTINPENIEPTENPANADVDGLILALDELP